MSARADVRHLIANRVCVISGEAQLAANDPRCDKVIKAKLQHIDKVARQLMTEVLEMFPEETEAERDRKG